MTVSNEYINFLLHSCVLYVVVLMVTVALLLLTRNRKRCRVSFSDFTFVNAELDRANETIRSLAGNEYKLRKRIETLTLERKEALDMAQDATEALSGAAKFVRLHNETVDSSCLGISFFDFDCKVNQKNIRTRYKLLAKVFHPDFGGSKELMQILNSQYEKVKEMK
ncbi:hypothetical protein VF_A0671 [Aliivibrio fischeri ES114]|uniref:J domain-containing protein n=1 Tax=Aliivibrio fischeri (strain ATCC 700601 / ES114) TaxID=312309 RepID=Q5DZQ5_ALIF1|nr:hypothetical protein [Aliivibrio fischeri]AAW87741.1 hypothetical protein VF_A0671 [Aliivibrio fischeri ES114]